MKRFPFLLFVALTALPLWADDAQDLKNAEGLLVKTKNEAEFKQAMDSGALFIQTNRGSYFVRIPEKYAGPFRDLSSAVRVRRQYKLEIPAPSANPSGGTQGGGLGFVYNPQLMLFPFTEVAPDQKTLFTLPGGEVVSASQVMIHPNPLSFDQISFAPIDLYGSLKSLSAMRKNQAPSPNALPPERRDDKYFAVTGRIVSRLNVPDATPALQYFIGASVVGAEGQVLWQNYCPVEGNFEFKSIKEYTPSRVQPQSLLLFILGKGELKQMLTPDSDIRTMDASSYPYHVLGSVALEMAPNWFPPLEKAAKEEYQSMLDQMQNNKKAPPIPRLPGSVK